MPLQSIHPLINLPFGRIRVIPITIPVADLSIGSMDEQFGLLIPCNPSGYVDSLALGGGCHRYTGIPGTPYRPAPVVRHHMLIF